MTTTSELRRTHARFADDNPLLFLSLGLLASFETLDRILDEHASDSPRSERNTSSEEDAGVDFVLGLLAVRARLEGHLGTTTIDKPKGAEALVEPNKATAPTPARRDSFYR